MSSWLDRLNLHPQERRLVVGVAAVVFVVLNLWLVWPHFKDWRTTLDALDKAKIKLALYQKEIAPAHLAELQTRLRELESQGSSVAPSEQALNLAATVRAQAYRTGVQIMNDSAVNTSSSTKTNDYFERQARRINFLAEERQLVSFLVSLGASNSMIRAHSMILRPDAPHYRLEGEITLVASYQKEPSKPAGTAPVPVANRGRRNDNRPARVEPGAAQGQKKSAPAVKGKSPAPSNTRDRLKKT